MEKELVSSVVQDYRITRTASTVTIEVLDYHAEPLTLTREQLREFGLQLIEDPRLRARRLPFEGSPSGARSTFSHDFLISG